MRLAVLGATGSIGKQTLDVASRLEVEVPVLAARRLSPELMAAAHGCHAEAVAVDLPESAALPKNVPWRWLTGPDSLRQAAAWRGVDTVLVAVTGLHGIEPSLEALSLGRRLCLANKEALVVAGALLKAKQGELLPVDSEHSGLWQLMAGRRHEVERLILTASGGALRDVPLALLPEVTPQRALQHPTWKMGPKLTIDCATLMNKGLEVLEAAVLFDLSVERIDVALHPQSIVHALVQLSDGSLLSQLASPDMRLPIAYALTFPERKNLGVANTSVSALGTLTFAPVPDERYPALKLCYEVGKMGETMPAVLNAANEVAVHAFLAGQLAFDRIVPLVEEILALHQPVANADLEALRDIDAWARRRALELVQ